MANFEDYWQTEARKAFCSIIDQLKTCEWMTKEKPANLVMVGPSGSGKSWLASAFARQACHLNLKVQFIGCTQELLNNLKQRDQVSDRLFRKVIKVQLLILDDFLLNVPTEAECYWLHEIIQKQYQKKSTIVLSQKPIVTWSQILPRGASSDALVDRFHHIQLMEPKSLREFIQ